jgi:hypothetical protein
VKVTRAGDFCVLCPRNRPRPAVATYTDFWGYVYPLCEGHLPGVREWLERERLREAKRQAGTLRVGDLRPWKSEC